MTENTTVGQGVTSLSDVIELARREICGQVWERRGSKCAAAQYRRGDFDDGLGPSMTIALACLRRGIEIAGGGNG